jgi:hypothetical protein
MKQSIFIFFILLSISSKAQLSNNNNKTMLWSTDLSHHLSTDKSVYKPGEIIWFNWETKFGDGDLQTKPPTEMTVKLLKEDGSALVTDKYKLVNGHAFGDILLPENINPGKVTLTVLLPDEAVPEKAFSRSLIVRKYSLNGRKLSIEGPKADVETDTKNKSDNSAPEAGSLKVALVADEKTPKGKTFKLSIALTDDAGKALAGRVCICISDTAYLSLNEPSREYIKQNSALFKKSSQTGNKAEAYKALLAKSTNLLDVLQTIKPLTVTNDKIFFAGSQNSLSDPPGALIVIDGQQMGEYASVLNNIMPQDVVEIKMSKDPSDIQRYSSSNTTGVIVITTIKTQPKVVQATSVQEVLYDGKYRRPRTFPVISDKQNDFRTTLYWNTELKLNNTGQITIEIPASQIVSDFRITAEGRDDNGRGGFATKMIKVTE